MLHGTRQLTNHPATNHLTNRPAANQSTNQLPNRPAGRCFTDHGQRFNYEACLFDRATQSEPHNPANKVNLGSWLGFEEGNAVLVFANGDPCSGVGGMGPGRGSSGVGSMGGSTPI